MERHEVSVSCPKQASEVDLLFAFDTRPVTQSAAGLNMPLPQSDSPIRRCTPHRCLASLRRLQTCFICLALAAGAISFARDAHALLLGPLERILVKLEAKRASETRGSAMRFFRNERPSGRTLCMR